MSNIEAIELLYLPSTLEEASKLGTKFYFTGKPCKKGHLCKRSTKGRYCLDCRKVWNEENPDYYSNWVKNNKERAKQYKKNWIKNNPDYNWAENNRERSREIKRKWREKHKSKPKLHTDIPKPSDVDCAWTAGIIDGEGCVYLGKAGQSKTLTRNYFYMRLSVANTDKKMVDKLQKLWGGSVHERYEDRKERSNLYFWTVAANKALFLLESIVKYMVTKKEHAKNAIEFQKRVKDRIGLYTIVNENLKDKNGRGGMVGTALTDEETAIRIKMVKKARKLNKRGGRNKHMKPRK